MAAQLKYVGTGHAVMTLSWFINATHSNIQYFEFCSL